MKNYGNYPDLFAVKRVLVIKMRHHGDVLLTSPLFTNLKRYLPAAQIDALLYRDTLPMLEGHSAISEFLLYDRKWKELSLWARMKREFSLLWQVRKNRYDLVINLTEGDRGAIVSLISGSRLAIGFDPEGKGFIGKRKIYTKLVKNCKTPRHAVERNLDALRCLGIFPKEEERDLELKVGEAEGSGFVLVHPVSRWRFKCLPVEKVAEVIRELQARGERVVVTASPDPIEVEMVGEILRLLPEGSVQSYAGKTTLKELAALIKQAKCVITVDSVPLHIASATKTPLLAIFGPTSEKNWGPWMHKRARVVTLAMPCRPCHQDGCGGSKRSDCLQSLPSAAIMRAYDELMSPPPRHSAP